jgi:hypothetical protein
MAKRKNVEDAKGVIRSRKSKNTRILSEVEVFKCFKMPKIIQPERISKLIYNL